MENFGWFDGIVLTIIIISGIIAFYRGFIREGLGLASWILAAIAGFYGFSLLSPLYSKVIANQLIADIVSGITIALLALVFCILLTGRINRKVRESSLNGLDRILGFLFGLARGGLIVILLYILFLVVSPVETQKFETENKNISMAYIVQSIEYGKTLLPSDIAQDLTAKQEDAKKAVKKSGKVRTDKGDELFEKLNEPKPAADKNKAKGSEGYNDKERDNMTELMDTLDSSSAQDESFDEETQSLEEGKEASEGDNETEGKSVPKEGEITSAPVSTLEQDDEVSKK